MTREAHSMGTGLMTYSQDSESYLEPMQCVSESEPPPKRFFRTFWRSVTRRILQHQENKAAFDSMTM
jgi:hypothetical protein